MIPAVIISLLVLSLAYYLSFLWTVWRGLSAAALYSSKRTPAVSVVIAVRNEESAIGQCIQSLAGQSYGRSNFELILVDDHSQDHTLDVAKRTASSLDGLRVTFRSCKDIPGLKGKPAAIAHGIASATGEVILCTDADCIAPPEWIASTVRCFEQSVVFVAGPVAETSGRSALSKLQSLEFLGLIATGAGLISSGKPIICNGANIAYLKSAFQAVNGYGETGSSCDDETLMQRMVLRKVGRVVFNFDRAATVTTVTPDTISGFWNQRTRWAAKRGHYEDKSILSRLVFLFGFFIVALLSALSVIYYPVVFFPLLIVFGIKAAAELSILQLAARLFGQQLSGVHFVIAEVFHVPYIVFAALAGQFRTLRWKNRDLGR
jgi:poly-beta-1,6-N-acetyl-D-glucosamine synthase